MEARCCVVGGGPAGMMLGLLLARAGVDVVVLEKHPDFLRDFRGDTIHPATLELMAELGLLEEFLRLPHTEVRELQLVVEGERFSLVDFSRLPTRCQFMAIMPQWDFLSFLAGQARRYPTFRLEMCAEVTDLLWSEERAKGQAGERRVVGVRAITPQGDVEVRAHLTVGCDGRFSTVRERAGLPARAFPMSFDVLWFRLPHEEGAAPTLGSVGGGQMVLALDRGDYWQCGTVIQKGSLERLRAAGLEAFREGLVRAAPFLREPVAALRDWEQVKLLSVRADRLRRWYRPGLLCIGDAAHAMSPAGAAGVNYAIADAVAAANLLAGPLRERTVEVEDLRRVQRRRQGPVGRAQALQRRQAGQLAAGGSSRAAIAMLRLLSRCPPARRLLGRLIGLGFGREHVRVAEQVRPN